MNREEEKRVLQIVGQAGERDLHFALYTLFHRDRLYVDPSTDDFGAIIQYAVLYTLGRDGELPETVLRFLTPYVPYLTRNTRKKLIAEIRDWLSYSMFHSCVNEWKQLLHMLESAIHKEDTSDA